MWQGRLSRSHGTFGPIVVLCYRPVSGLRSLLACQLVEALSMGEIDRHTKRSVIAGR